MSQLKNYYDILQIPQNASSYEIEQAYQKLSGIWHPDRHKTHRRSAQVKFHDICEAYQTLSNKNRRAHYDELLSKQYSIQDANKTFQQFYGQYGVQEEAQKKFFQQHYPQLKRNYYDVLQIPRNASFQQIKKAYRRLALKYHPKNNPDNQQNHRRFVQACEAFNALEDQAKRQNYNDLIFNRQIAPVRAHDIFQDFWSNKVFEIPNCQQFFKPILHKKWSSNLDRLMNNGDQGNIQNGEIVKTSTVYTNNNGIESKKTVTTKRKIQGGLPVTTTTEQYEFPNGTNQVRVIKDDGRGNIITDLYNLRKGQNLPIKL